MKYALLAFLMLVTACDSGPENPHLVTICVDGHWGPVTRIFQGRFTAHEYVSDEFICEKEVTQCQAGDGFIGEVTCGN